eukprot:5033130-Pyramimonas_sp.AAC.1
MFWQWVPSRIFLNSMRLQLQIDVISVKDCKRCPVQAVDIARYAAAAKYRLARRSGIFLRPAEEYHDMLGGDSWSFGEAELYPAYSKGSLVHRIAMLSVSPYLHPRQGCWMKGRRVDRQDSTVLFMRMQMIAARMPCSVLASVFKTASTAWATTAPR